MWRERRRRAEERVREEARRQAAQQHREQMAEWAREQAEHRKRMEAKRAEARRKEAERMARARQQEEERAKGRMAAAWAAYVRRWEEIEQRKDPLTFGMVPWPVLSMPRSAADLTLDAIAAFLLSPAHSGKKSKKDRIRQAPLRWHPDKLVRFLERVKKRGKGEGGEWSRVCGQVSQ